MAFIASVGLKMSAASLTSEPYIIPIVCLDKVPIIEVQLNGLPAYFILDSGSDISVLNLADADRYLFTTKQIATRDLKGFSGGRQGIFSVKSAELVLSSYQINSSFYTTDLDHLVQTLEKSTSITVNGIIGLDIMKEYGFEIDYANKIVRFSTTNL